MPTRTLAAGALAAGLLIGLTGCAALTAPKATPTPARTHIVTTPTPTPTTPFDYSALHPKVTFTVRSKECFGDSGCVVDIEMALGLDDPDAVPDGATGSIAYTVKGGDDGPIQDTLDLTGKQYNRQREVVNTPTRDSKITVTVDSIVTD